MCYYYAHSHICGHTTTVFAAYCAAAALVQTPCKNGQISATVKVANKCTTCRGSRGRAAGQIGYSYGSVANVAVKGKRALRL